MNVYVCVCVKQMKLLLGDSPPRTNPVQGNGAGEKILVRLSLGISRARNGRANPSSDNGVRFFDDFHCLWEGKRIGIKNFKLW